MGLGAMCQPGRWLFWQLCIGTNKVHFFTELHPLSVCLLTPAPWVGPLPLRGPGEERRGQWGSGHVGHSPLEASGLPAANECHFCL